MTNWLFGLVDFNSWATTDRCVRSIRREFVNAQIVVVDNYGGYEPEDASVVVLWPQRNTGFAGGVNLIFDFARASDADCLWLLNNDCVLIGGAESSVNQMLSEVEADVYTSTILHGDSQSIWYGGGWANTTTVRQRHLRYGELYDEGESAGWVETDWASGASMMLPRATFDRCSYFDEDLFLYLEEVDWQQREGSRVVCLRRALVRHYAGSTTRAAHSRLETFFTARNSLLIGFRSESLLDKVRFLLSWSLRFVVKPAIRRDRQSVLAAVLGWRARKLAGSVALESFLAGDSGS